ncbi:aspartyl protease family protein [Mucilaginibacter sp.]|uniref:aspartyl protease family protein n=1 Tax=Mucilaginibacter sp. TaxID=1882438 RepID=UPI003264B553
MCNCITYGQPAFKLSENRKRVTLPFNFTRNLIVVRVTVNHKGPYNFILDSGVGLMIITDPKLLDSLNITYKRTISVSGLGEGKDFEAYVVRPLKVELPGIEGNNISAAILKKDEFGLSNYAGLPIHGLLGYDFFNSFAVKLNFSDSTIVVGQLTDMHVFRKSERLSLSIEDNKPYILSGVKIKSDGNITEDKLILDLGAGHPLSLENLVGQNKGLPDKFIASNLGVSLTGPIRGYLSRISEFRIGKYKLKDVIVSFPEFDTIKNNLLNVKRDGNIGIAILKKFNIIIDYQSGSLYLRPNSLFGEPFEHDMSGLEYYSAGPDLKHVIISNVEKGSAGAEIGLQAGDEIVSINFKPVDKMTIEEIDKIFCSKHDRSLLLEIFHDKQYDKVIMVLKRRV